MAMALAIGGLYGAAGGFTTAFGIGMASMAANYFLGSTVEGPREKNLSPPESREGTAIPKGFGLTPAVGTIVWATPKKEHKHEESAGKGGGPSVTSYTYTGSYGLVLGVGPIRRVQKIYLGQKLIYDWNGGAPRGEEKYLGKKKNNDYFVMGMSATYEVTGAGESRYNGTYVSSGVKNGKTYYKMIGENNYIYYRSGNRWCMDRNLDQDVYPYYTDAGAGDVLPVTGWVTGEDGTGSPPSITLVSRDTSNSTMMSNNGKVRIRLGTETQMPDSSEEADRGAGNVPAYRGRVTIYFEELDLSSEFGNNWPQVTCLLEEKTKNLASVANWITKEANSYSDDYDYCGIANQTIRGFTLPQQRAASDYMNQVGLLGVCDFVERDWKLRAITRGRDICETIPRKDLQAYDDGGEMPELTITKADEITRPRSTQVAYIDASRNHTTSMATAWREVDGESGGIDNVDLSNAVLFNSEARRYAEIALYTKLSQSTSTSLSLTGEHADLASADAVMVETDSGNEPFLLQSAQESLFGGIEFKAVSYMKSAYDYPMPESTAGLQPSLVNVAGEYSYALIDTNARDNSSADKPKLLIAATTPEGTAFREVTVSSTSFTRDDDDDSLETAGTVKIKERAKLGSVVGTLGPYQRGNSLDPGSFDFVDMDNEIIVDMVYGDLASIDEDVFMFNAADRSGGGWWGTISTNTNPLQNTVVVGREIVKFRDAEYLGEFAGRKRYKCTRLLRGRRGTEWYSDKHRDGEAFVCLDSPVYYREVLQGAINSPIELNAGYSTGSAQESVSLVFYGNTIKPYSVHNVRAERSGAGDIVFLWDRRSRYNVPGWWGISTGFGGGSRYIRRDDLSNWFNSGTVDENGFRDITSIFFGGLSGGSADPQLGEETESYDLEILDENGNVLRTYTVTSPALFYSASDQIYDFGQIMSEVTINIYQNSKVLGRGYQATITV